MLKLCFKTGLLRKSLVPKLFNPCIIPKSPFKFSYPLASRFFTTRTFYSTVHLNKMEGRYQPPQTQFLPEYQVDYVKLHAANRSKVVKRFKEELNITTGVVFVKGGETKTLYDSDTEISFRQESNFQYLFGAAEQADCFGAIDLATGSAILFVPRLPEEYAVWLGEIHPAVYFTKKYSVDDTHFDDEAESFLKGLNPDTIYTIASVPNLPGWLSSFNVNKDKLKYVLDECRLIKSDEELKLIRYINKISSYAHIETMKACSPDIYQYELEATFLHLTYTNGRCRHAAYGCICATGKNAATLHYPENSKKIVDGQIALMDMGAQYHGYCSDITCSYPVNGKFTEDQKVIYNIVLDSQLAVMNAMKPGIQWEDMHRLAEKVICEGLLKHGFLKGTVEELIQNHVPALFFPHGLGHMLGLDTHDAGGYPPGISKINEPGIKNLRARRVLEKGMVLTVEPGIYFIDANLVPAMKDEKMSKFLNIEKINKFMDFGGVRIEDDVVVTETGMENLTLCPRTVEDIERVMQTKDSKKFEALILQ